MWYHYASRSTSSHGIICVAVVMSVCGLHLLGCHSSEIPQAETQRQEQLPSAGAPPRLETTGSQAIPPVSELTASELAASELVLEKLEQPHLPNAIRLNQKVISGGQPEGEMGFVELEQLGIRTIISVDGATPDVAAAQAHGMRYVHLPHGYNGVPQLRAKELAKCVSSLPGPIYIHCHHGKHRSPAAATVASIGAGLMRPSDGLSVLQAAGTNPNYKGLYQAAENAHRFEQALLDELECPFPSISKLPPMAEAMVQLEHTFDNVKRLKENQWLPLEEHPDITASHESLILLEHFKEMLRDHTKSEPTPEFRALVQRSADLAEKIHSRLEDRNGSASDSSFPACNQWFDEIHSACKECHQKFRDVPLERN